MFGIKESVLIVEAENVGTYSKLLYNLIGTNDDAENEAVGPVDGSVDASIFTENQFSDTPLSSSQKVVFIGKPKGAGDYIAAIRAEDKDPLDQDGVYVGISGKQACIQVADRISSKETYWDFLELAKGKGQHFDDLLADLRPSEDESQGHRETPLDGVAKFLGGLPPVKAASGAAENVGQGIEITRKAGDIRDQMYRFAVKYFYREKLRGFVEA